MTSLTATIHKPSKLTIDDIDRWRRFQKGSPDLANPFLSYRYSHAAEQAFDTVYVVKLKHSSKDEAVGFFSIQFRSMIHRLCGIGQRVSGELADYFGLIAARDFKISEAELVRAANLNAIYFTHLEETQTAFGLTGSQPELGIRIDFPNGGEAFWENRRKLDKKFTGDTERRERRLIETHGPLRFVFRHVNCMVELQNLIEAKRVQYARTGVKDSMAKASTRKFLEILSHISDPDCRATLSTLHAGDQWIASHFGLMYGSTLHYWFPVYNPQMRNFGPGRLLIKAIIDASIENGVTRIDRGAGESQAKLDFGTSRHQFLRGIWSRPGVVSFGYRAALSAGWRWRMLRDKYTAESAA
jgi:CelD/BcsL family acetyltransferase involved in cellulose biosynthesis